MAKVISIRVQLADTEKPTSAYATVPTELFELYGANLAEQASVEVWNAVEKLLNEDYSDAHLSGRSVSDELYNGR